MRAGQLAAAHVLSPRRTPSRLSLVDLTPLDALLARETTGEGGAVAEDRAVRFTAARSLFIGGVIAAALLAVALIGVTVTVSDVVTAFIQS